MFATGIGITKHILYVKDLINKYNNCEVKTQRILVIWQINKESKSGNFSNSLE
jgi:hypothetical protein